MNVSNLDTLEDWENEKGALLLGVLALTLAGCSASKPDMYVEDGAYNLSAQEYIDRINEVVAIQNDSRYLEIPDFESSGETIEIDSFFLEVKISTNTDGNITEIKYSWDGARDDIGYSVGLYTGYTMELLGFGDSDAVYDQLDMMNPASTGYETSYSEAGTLFSYWVYGYGQYNHLIIAPEEA